MFTRHETITDLKMRLASIEEAAEQANTEPQLYDGEYRTMLNDLNYLENDAPVYDIVRYRFKQPAEIVKRGLTLAEAREHCSRKDTRGDGWFDGYMESDW